ncbi:MAG: hypothetical protein K0S26_3431 [Bacteroidota bacterium]|jgi:hypothetical protein|nr:hypothetical protein [Bacteroidota bacterium]
MKKLVYILLICSCLTRCTKCKRVLEPVDYGFNTPVNPDLYAYAYFKPGTYWVYQDSISGILDSVYITFAKKGTYTNGDAEVAKGYYRGTFNWFTCDAISSYDHYRYQNWMDQSYEVNGSAPTINRERYIMPGSDNKNGETIHTAVISVGQQLTSYPDYIYYQYFYSNVVLNGFIFNNVQRW